MQSLFWHLASRTQETQFIFNLFHLLLAGLTLLVVTHQLREERRGGVSPIDRLLPLGFFLLVLHFSLLTLYFGAGFYFHKELGRPEFGSISHGLIAASPLLLACAFSAGQNRAARLLRPVCGVLVAAVLIDALVFLYPLGSPDTIQTACNFVIDMVGSLGAAAAAWVVKRKMSVGRRILVFAFASLSAAFLLQELMIFAPHRGDVLVWNVEQHILSASLFAFAWVVGVNCPRFCTTVRERVYITASGCESGLGASRGL